MPLFRRSAAAVGALAVLLAGAVIAAGPAAAHVSVSAPDAVQGGYAVLTLRVPTESDTARTVGLRVQLPPDAPIASVRVQPKPGWTVTVHTRTVDPPLSTEHGPLSEVVSEIDWTTTGAGIGPGEFDEFAISAGPLPRVAVLTLKAIQQYSDGSEVRWVEVGQPGTELDHPAPTVRLAPAADVSAAPGADRSGAAAAPQRPAGRGLAVAALIVAVAAVALAGLACLAWVRPRARGTGAT